MKILLDTQCWLWSVREPERLNRRARELFDDHAHQLFLSIASIWEITIKYQTGKLPLPSPPEDCVPEFLRLQQINTLPIAPAHIYRTRRLPVLHRDPFDRLLIAQTLTEKFKLMTADHLIRQYKLPLVWAAHRKAKP